MGQIKIQRGLERDDVVDQYGDVLGVAVYDLDDAYVRANIIKMKDGLKAVGERFQTQADALQADKSEDEDGMPLNALAIANLNIQCVDEMIGLIDGVFGDSFSANAIGADNKNPNDLWAVIGAVCESYGVKARAEMDKYVNRAQRRAKK